MLMTQRETQPLPESGRQELADQQPICIFPKDCAKGGRAQVKQSGSGATRENRLPDSEVYQLFERIVRSVPSSLMLSFVQMQGKSASETPSPE